jgi:hypothetical protein
MVLVIIAVLVNVVAQVEQVNIQAYRELAHLMLAVAVEQPNKIQQ